MLVDGGELGMTTNPSCKPPFQVTTYRDGQAVIIETLDTEIAARTRFASAVDLCRTLDQAHVHSVELRANTAHLIDSWTSVTPDVAERVGAEEQVA
ncbi:hypothetical protein [Methylorubrum sp. SB2]|uniref:hypothetical protein n=1 Tax=Methylorubrum subtropicum TaxID=3138812 RepID=UPI00313DB40A